MTPRYPTDPLQARHGEVCAALKIQYFERLSPFSDNIHFLLPPSAISVHGFEFLMVEVGGRSNVVGQETTLIVRHCITYTYQIMHLFTLVA